MHMMQKKKKKKKEKNLGTDHTAFTKINSRWITDLKVKCKCYVVENLDDLRFGNDFSILIFFLATPVACGSSQARDWIWAAAEACTTATSALDLSGIWDLRCSFRQRWILNSLSEARDWTCILTGQCWVLNPSSHNGNSGNDIPFNSHFASCCIVVSKFICSFFDWWALWLSLVFSCYKSMMDLSSYILAHLG